MINAPDNYENVNCLLCNADEPELRFETTHLNYPIFVQKCNNCGFMYYSPRPSSAMFDELYKHHYFGEIVPDFSAKNIFNSKLLAERARLKTLLTYADQTELLVEVGSSYGYQLMAASEVFERVIGVELNDSAVKYSRNLGFEVLNEDLLQCDIEHNSVDVFVMYTVIEHLLDPVPILKKIFGCLKPGGILVAQTCNANSLPLKKAGVNTSAICIDHVSYFTDKSLKKMLQVAGFKVDDLLYNRGLGWRDEFEYQKIQNIDPVRETDPLKYRKLLKIAKKNAILRSFHIGSYTYNITVTAIGRKAYG